MAFIQEDFSYKDLFTENSYLKDVLAFYLPDDVKKSIEEDIAKFSSRCNSDVLEMSKKAEREEPEWVPFDHWGKRVDDIIMSDGWQKLHDVSAEEGIVAIGYERKSQEYSRLHQFTKLMLFHPSSAFFTCPLAMTDGATRVIETSDNQKLKDLCLKHLLSREGEEFWTAGQWMTEKSGGSDVSKSETIAKSENGKYFLYGTKWFTSAITANIAFTLARTTDDSGKEGLSMFFVKLRNEKGELDHIEVLRLKDKLGTRAMPTAEIELKGCEAILVGNINEGVKNIATVLNISRLYNSVCATGALYRLISLSRDYSTKRIAFGKKLSEHPLHTTTLFDWQVTANACVHFVQQMAIYLGKSETGKANETEAAMLRMMTPIIKLWTGKKAVVTISELIESFGGAGYIEDTGLPKFLRDNQVLSIWEGTTNILSLDTLRAMSKGNILEFVLKHLAERVNKLSAQFTEEKTKLGSQLQACQNFIQNNLKANAILESGARNFAFAMGDIFCAILLLEFATKTQKKRDLLVAQRFCHNIQKPDFLNSAKYIDDAKEALFN